MIQYLFLIILRVFLRAFLIFTISACTFLLLHTFGITAVNRVLTTTSYIRISDNLSVRQKQALIVKYFKSTEAGWIRRAAFYTTNVSIKE